MLPWYLSASSASIAQTAMLRGESNENLAGVRMSCKTKDAYHNARVPPWLVRENGFRRVLGVGEVEERNYMQGNIERKGQSNAGY